MSLRSQQAARRRQVLVAMLGGSCQLCGRTEHLEFHLLSGDGAAHHLMSSRDRVYFYSAEAARGNLRLVCRDCHRRLSAAQNALRRAARFGYSMEGVPSSPAAASFAARR